MPGNQENNGTNKRIAEMIYPLDQSFFCGRMQKVKIRYWNGDGPVHQDKWKIVSEEVVGDVKIIDFSPTEPLNLGLNTFEVNGYIYRFFVGPPKPIKPIPNGVIRMSEYPRSITIDRLPGMHRLREINMKVVGDYHLDSRNLSIDRATHTEHICVYTGNTKKITCNPNLPTKIFSSNLHIWSSADEMISITDPLLPSEHRILWDKSDLDVKKINSVEIYTNSLVKINNSFFVNVRFPCIQIP